MDCPRSNIALSNLVAPIMYEIVKLIESLGLGCNFLCNKTETFSLKLTISLPYS